MVQYLLRSVHRRALIQLGFLAGAVLVASSLAQASHREKKAPEAPWPELLMDGGRRLTYQQTLLTERDVKDKPGFWTKMVNVLAGDPEYRGLIRPYSIAVDSRG